MPLWLFWSLLIGVSCSCSVGGPASSLLADASFAEVDGGPGMGGSTGAPSPGLDGGADVNQDASAGPGGADGEPSDGAGSGGGAAGLGGTTDAGASAADGATGGVGGSSGATGTGGFGGAAICADIVINEVSPEGTKATDEFVELHNRANCTAPLNGFSLRYAAASGATSYTVWAAGQGDSIPPSGYFLVAGGGYAGPTDGHLLNALALSGGGLGLFRAQDQVDGVAYGTASTGHPFAEGSVAPAASAPQSIGRAPNGKDTQNNSADFKSQPRTPLAPN